MSARQFFLWQGLFFCGIAMSKAVTMRHIPASTDFTLLVYMVNNNNLQRYGQENFNQMLRIGSTQSINVFVQIDDVGKKTATRYFIQNGFAIPDVPGQHVAGSGSADNLFDFIKCGIDQFPARYYGLVMWNHGSGIKDSSIWGRFFLQHRDDFFVLDKATGLLEIDKKKVEKRLAEILSDKKGICYNDITQEYLSNQDLRNVLDQVRLDLLDGRKLDIVCFDACHMSMVEIASEIKDSVSIMVGSENIELATGYDYAALLLPFIYQTMAPADFARHVVEIYEKQYRSISADYTHSAIDLYNFEMIEQNISQVADCLSTLIKTKEFADKLKNLRKSKTLTTEFCDVDYIDVLHFYRNLLVLCQGKGVVKTAKKKGRRPFFLCWSYERTLNRLKDILEKGICMFQTIKIHNVAGRNYPWASGLAIYYPIRKHEIDPSYVRTQFAQTTKWLQFLVDYQGLSR